MLHDVRLRAHLPIPSRRTLAAFALFFTVVTLGACLGTGASPSPTAPMIRDLVGTSWRGILIRDAEPIADAPPTIRFDAGQAGGTTGCNVYGGAWSLEADGTFSIESMVMTEMACDGPRGTQEGAVIEILQNADTLEFLADGTIRISGSAGSITFAEDPR